MGVLTPQIITMLSIGLAVVAMLGTQSWRYNSLNREQLKSMSDQITTSDHPIDKLETRVTDIDKQMSHLDGLLEGLWQAIAGCRAAQCA